MNKNDNLLDLIKNLLCEKESCELDFKESRNCLPKNFWETYSAFANTQGGYIVLGVSENEQNVVVGVSEPDKIKREIFSSANNKNKVSHNIIEERNVNVHIIDDKVVISVYVPELPSHRKPLFLNDNLKCTYIRKGDGDYRASDEDLRRFIRNSCDDNDGELLDDQKYNIDDLNLNSVRADV